jgi:predicted transposase/invertase (TIGR01784 family)
MPIETREYYDQNMRTELDIIAQTDYAVKQGEARGRAEGEAKGRAEGKAEGKAEVAKAMLKKGLTVDMVMSCTGLSKKEVEHLAK